MANFEHSHATMRIRGSYNVHVYGFKCEAPSAVYVFDSDNVNVFGNGGNALRVCGGWFFGWFSFLVLGLFHIVIVAGQYGTPGVRGWRLAGI